MVTHRTRGTQAEPKDSVLWKKESKVVSRRPEFDQSRLLGKSSTELRVHSVDKSVCLAGRNETDRTVVCGMGNEIMRRRSNHPFLSDPGDQRVRLFRSCVIQTEPVSPRNHATAWPPSPIPSATRAWNALGPFTSTRKNVCIKTALYARYTKT